MESRRRQSKRGNPFVLTHSTRSSLSGTDTLKSPRTGQVPVRRYENRSADFRGTSRIANHPGVLPPPEQRELPRSRDSAGCNRESTSQLWESTGNPDGHFFTGTRGRTEEQNPHQRKSDGEKRGIFGLYPGAGDDMTNLGNGIQVVKFFDCTIREMDSGHGR